MLLLVIFSWEKKNFLAESNSEGCDVKNEMLVLQKIWGWIITSRKFSG